jgi:hypothetical protein
VAKLLLLLNAFEMGFTLFSFLLCGIVLPDLNSRVTSTCHDMQSTIVLYFIVIGQDFFYFLEEINCPNFIVMHLKGVDALLSLYIPNFNDAID